MARQESHQSAEATIEVIQKESFKYPLPQQNSIRNKKERKEKKNSKISIDTLLIHLEYQKINRKK